MRRVLVWLGVLWLAASCASAPPTFSLTGATVDPTYWCPGGAINAPYDLHATIKTHNGTTKAVTISSITAEMKLTAVTGNWLEKVGDRYEAESVKFEPTSVGAGASTALKLTIPSACTSGAYGSSVSSSGRYEVTIHVSTSSGAFTILAANSHEILTA